MLDQKKIGKNNKLIKYFSFGIYYSDYIMKNKKFFLLAVAFISGLAVMAMEISASRLLAPYYGSSIFVWTNIIGVVMAALSLGYYYGGKLADRKPRIDFLLRLIFTAGLLFLAVPLIIKPISAAINPETIGLSSATAVILFSSLILTAALFAFPMFLLGMVSPFIVKLYLLIDAGRAGEAAGRIFAVSTIGSLLGTFLPTLLFIPFLGTRATINIFAMLLVILGVFGFKKNKVNFFVLFVLAGLLSGANLVQAGRSPDTIFTDESAYQYIQVRQDRDGTRYLMTNEGAGVQSVYNPEQVLTGYYYDYFNVLPDLVKAGGPKKILIIGLCGGTIAHQLNYFFPGELEIDGVEIDPKVIAAGKKFFALDQAGVNIYNADGRMFLMNNKKKYDLIIVDAYAHEYYIPWTMTTKEFWGLVKASLEPGGMTAINVNATGPDSRLLKSIANTMAYIFPAVYITPVSNGNLNYVLTATDVSLNFTGLAGRVKDQRLYEIALAYEDSTRQDFGVSAQAVLTDDRAPIEFMSDLMFWDYLKGYDD